MSSFSMIRNLDENRVEFLRFHDADFVVVLQSGEERLLKKDIWKVLPDWTVHATANAQIENRLRT